MQKILLALSCLIFLNLSLAFAQENPVIARIQYTGGGDWYNDPEIIPNLAKYANQYIKTNFALKEKTIKLNDKKLFEYPFIFITGHGNILFNEDETNQLRAHLESGALLYADDDYGMDQSFRREMKKVFPDKELVELPKDHAIYHCFFDFPNGIPKIHEHDKKRPQLFAIYSDTGRIMVLYSYETNISDGWANPDTHNDSPEIRDTALKFGTNILYYFLTGEKS